MTLLERHEDASIRSKRFTASEVQQMLDAGILPEKAPYELLNGELIEMAPQGSDHVTAGSGLADWFARRLPEHLRVTAHSPLRLSEIHEPEPDLYVHARALNPNRVRGADTVLVIEVSDTRLRKDRLIKAPIYAAEGVRLYWIVDLKRRTTWVHRLGVDGYGEPEAVPFTEPLPAPEVAEPLIVADLFK